MGTLENNFIKILTKSQFSSFAQSCLTLCEPMNRSTPGLPVHHQLQEFTQTHVHLSVMTSSQLILCRPLLLLNSIPPSIRVFSNESTLLMKWPKYWSFSFSIIPSNYHYLCNSPTALRGKHYYFAPLLAEETKVWGS